ncbi:hypothetical protein LTR10_011811 [Elasticomyces elasticus]|nr:hypothetical protein LTR10_011811 [Elasticomyces elasticus]
METPLNRTESDSGRSDLTVILSSYGACPRQQQVHGKDSAIPGLQEFRGIPYGIVSSRWKASSLRTELPSDSFYATKNGPKCPQPSGPNKTLTYQSHLDFPLDVAESEFECLNLFIIRPAISLQASPKCTKLPVYVYIHGGAYAFGSATDPMWGKYTIPHTNANTDETKDPSRLVAKSVAMSSPIIAVGINYRLNLFGFAASRDLLSQSPSGCNYGLADQRVALEWVYQNIAAFGGDPDKVIVGGQSAGASSSHAQFLNETRLPSPRLRGAILQSAAMGTLGPLSIEEADDRWHGLCRQLDVPTSLPAADKIRLVSQCSASQLLDAAQALNWHVCPLVADGRTIRETDDHSWEVILGPPAERLSSTRTLRVMIGDTDLEASKLTSSEAVQDIFDEHTDPEVSRMLRSLYNLGDGATPAEIQQEVMKFIGDVEFGVPVQKAKEALSRIATVCSYRVSFGNPWSGPFSGMAQHCVELLYLFDCFHDDLRRVDEDSSHAALVDRLQSDWIDFISSNDELDRSEVVYGKDRVKRRVQPQDDVACTERLLRLNAVKAHWQEARNVVNAISSI